jgi:hypothetical protein
VTTRRQITAYMRLANAFAERLMNVHLYAMGTVEKQAHQKCYKQNVFWHIYFKWNGSPTEAASVYTALL